MERHLKKTILRRNFFFWGKTGMQMTWLMLAFSLGYGVLFNLGRDLQTIGRDILQYGVIIQCMFAMIGAAAYVAYLSIALAFGSGRREAVMGYQFKNFVNVASSYVFLLLVWQLTAGWGTVTAVPALALLAGQIFMTAVGQIGGALVLRYSNKAYIIMLIFVGAVAGACGGFAVSAANEDDAWLSDVTAAVQSTPYLLLIAGFILAVGLYLVSVILLDHMLKTYEVRA